MKNLYSDLSPPTPKLYIEIREGYRNSIVDRFSMAFFVVLVIFNKNQFSILINIFLTNFSKVDSRYTFDVYNGHQEGRCLLLWNN